MSHQPLLSVKNLTTSFPTEKGVAHAVDDVSFELYKGECVGLVGESGSGKSITALSIMRLISRPGCITQGQVLFNNQDLLSLSERQMRHIRGNRISMIFQEPMTSLNPVFTVGDQIAEVYQQHQQLSKKQALEKSIEILQKVKIPIPEKRIHEYPHQLSGGMRQRVMIAMALACHPDLLIADEPTTALDVTIQAQILELIHGLQHDLGMSILLITHDLGVVAEVCTRVIIMYGGEIVESGSVREIFKNAQHPYTQGLLRAIPRLGEKLDILPTIPGSVPALGHFPRGCKFQKRCPYAMEICRRQRPYLKTINTSSIKIRTIHQAACWLLEKGDPSD